MISFSSSGLRIAEVWFDESDQGLGVDIVRYKQALAAPTGVESTPFFTLVVDLAPAEEDLLRAMEKKNQYEIRRAQKDGVTCGFSEAPDANLLERLRTVYDSFARDRELDPFPWDSVQRLAAAGQFEVSWASFAGAGEIVFHSYVKVTRRARLLHSASPPRPDADPSFRGLQGRANRLLHWEDIRRFKRRGFASYDLGGWYEGSTDTKRLQINAFKEAFGGRVEMDYNAERLVTLKARAAVVAARWMGRRK